ncbi:SDR family oxidoreductase [Stieleria sp. TO1_6]|uniref:SDR family oxidoreductase n=1 Tax=Stieleria tagensis TaxID=2956795 RepID=UPI00209B3DC8|nr:SDR family oxidoreductase [Stieleria tagensis]MCO8123965.1 SDR family oxidoreductase [Stieleria tagensis]
MTGSLSNDHAVKRNLNSKVALVTGASRGIGKAIAVRLAADGASVVVNYAGSADQAAATVKEIEEHGGRAISIQADVSKIADVKRMFDETTEVFGNPNVLVNNAGIMFNKPIVEMDEQEFDRLIAVNLKGTLFCCQEAGKRMTDGGHIINLSSSTTLMMLPNYGAYVASKGAVEQLSRVLAKELGSKKINVNIVSPGPTDTELFNQGKSEEQKQNFAQMAALGRLGAPDDIASVVAMLVSADAGWISGQNIRVNGGLV